MSRDDILHWYVCVCVLSYIWIFIKIILLCCSNSKRAVGSQVVYKQFVAWSRLEILWRKLGEMLRYFLRSKWMLNMRWREMVQTNEGTCNVKYVKAAIRVKALDCDRNALYAVEFYGDMWRPALDDQESSTNWGLLRQLTFHCFINWHHCCEWWLE